MIQLVLLIGDMHIPYRSAGLSAKFKKLLVPGKIQQVLCTGNLCTKETLDYLRQLAGEVHVVRGDMDDMAGIGIGSTTGAGASAGQSQQVQVQVSMPDQKVVTIGPWRVGLAHGHQTVPWGDPDSLAILQRQLDVDILVTGHTHRLETYEHDGAFFINPGSATGAFSVTGTGLPSNLPVSASATATATASTTSAASASMTGTGTGVPKAPTATGTGTGMGAGAGATAADGIAPIASFVLLDVQQASPLVLYLYRLVDDDVRVEKLEYKKPI